MLNSGGKVFGEQICGLDGSRAKPRRLERRGESFLSPSSIALTNSGLGILSCQGRSYKKNGRNLAADGSNLRISGPISSPAIIVRFCLWQACTSASSLFEHYPCLVGDLVEMKLAVGSLASETVIGTISMLGCCLKRISCQWKTVFQRELLGGSRSGVAR